MKVGIVVFPGSNCDRDLAVALESSGAQVLNIWHKDRELPQGLDLLAIPGGFSFGDYLRCGAIAARSPITEAIVKFANAGGYVLGICNGFQILTETELLPGALLRNAGIKYICRSVDLEVVSAAAPFLSGFERGSQISFPIAHHDGNYFASDADLDALEAEDRIALRYLDNPNGSQRDIAGIFSKNRRVLGMMPHPERAMSGHALDPSPGKADRPDGESFFGALTQTLLSAV